MSILNQLQGRVPRRYVALFTFFAFAAFFLWSGFDIIPRSGTVGRFHYVPSSYDWGKAKVYHPVKDMKKLPQGTPVDFPKIQLRKQSERQDATANSRKQIVKKAFIKSWESYKTHAWTKDELMPLSGKGKESFSGWSAQLVDALDSLWIMGLKDDFFLAVKEVAKIDWAKTKDNKVINLFEVTIRYLGGLLAAYDLSQEPVLLAKAIELGDALYATFDTPNRLPSHWLDYAKAKEGTQVADDSMSAAAGGTLSMEFTRLSQITGNPKYYDATERIKQFFYRFQNNTTLPGIWPVMQNYRDEEMIESRYTIGAQADSMYEYLVKMHPLLGGLDPQYPEMAIKALDTVRDNLLYRPMTPKDENILMAGNALMDHGNAQHIAEMQHLTCFAGGMYAMAGKLFKRDDYVDLGSRLSMGCVWAYNSFASGIMPEAADLVACKKLDGPCPYDEVLAPLSHDPRVPPGYLNIKSKSYLLRPEAIESLFYMWRITGKQVWRDVAWELWESLVRETETELAFAILEDVTVSMSNKGDVMETFWLAETLKYFYLIYEDDSVINLDERGLPLRCCDGGGRRAFHASRELARGSFEGKNHYERLKVPLDASPGEIKKYSLVFLPYTILYNSWANMIPRRSFYALSKAHHPDANRSDPDASHNFSLISESYTILSDPSRRATYDRDVLRLHEHHHHHHHPHHHGSYHSTNPAGGRPPSGLSRRRGTFRGPPPSFYRSGGWGAHADKRRQAHEESTGGAGSGSAASSSAGEGTDRANPWNTSAFHHADYGGMGPGSDPFKHRDEHVPHFDKAGHTRTHERQDHRRWQRQKRAVGDDDIEFEPQTSLAGHFLIVAGILAATFLAPAVYLQVMRLGRQKKEKES
ncbi:endoplasmic reticulum mannosyl-oligosaccharide 1,2-alpha-mannosidase [Trichoderma arundinaceum]|uniref:alpha-1,2-Mannosidase n=1 Tax=Trichoderma arundinaceum TaxID=490622 RepID=A0A395NE51_TRIAR|nr:endoplasmic reticulum mannosyl-oligosaccharide 1,2-alpha-mannosidase [Trichoderma arundinaceum]